MLNFVIKLCQYHKIDEKNSKNQLTKGEIGGNMWKSQEKSGEQKYKISEVWETA